MSEPPEEPRHPAVLMMPVYSQIDSVVVLPDGTVRLTLYDAERGVLGATAEVELRVRYRPGAFGAPGGEKTP